MESPLPPQKMFRIERLYIVRALIKSALNSVEAALDVRNIHIVKHPEMGDTMESEALLAIERAREYLKSPQFSEDR